MATLPADSLYLLATRSAQALLTVYKADLIADGKWGEFTNSTYLAAPADLRAIIDRMLAGLRLNVGMLVAKRASLRDSWQKSGVGPQATLAAVPSNLRINPKVASMSNVPSGTSISLVVSAARKAGITGTSLVNLLANIQVECGFVSKAEDHIYRDGARAKKVFSGLQAYTPAQVEALVKTGKSAFFEATYGHTTRVGKDLGNTVPGDGGKYYGRGLIQLTGKWNYAAFNAAFAQYDVLSKPDNLLSDINASVDAAIWFWKTKVMSKGRDRDIKSSVYVVNAAGHGMDARIAAAKEFSSTYA